uniref:Uncharacterized protein n=1 Tax=Cacopsylla melanoneura TaxID=428564 RepID=A0A8D8S5G9_9HEMI
MNFAKNVSSVNMNFVYRGRYKSLTYPRPLDYKPDTLTINLLRQSKPVTTDTYVNALYSNLKTSYGMLILFFSFFLIGVYQKDLEVFEKEVINGRDKSEQKKLTFPNR